MEHGRREKWVTKAIHTILADYGRNSIIIKELSHVRLDGVLAERTDDISLGESCPKVPVTKIITNNEANFIKYALVDYKKQGFTVNYTTVVAGEHVSVVERTIQTIKERVMAVRLSLPYKVEGKILSWLVGHVAMWINIMFSKRAPNSAWKGLVGS